MRVHRKALTEQEEDRKNVEDAPEEWYHVVTARIQTWAMEQRSKAANELKKAMSNPANFGIAKSFVMMGRDQGFDMSTEKGVQSWMEIYNAGIASGTQSRLPLPGEQSRNASNIRGKIKIVRPNRDRMAKASRKKNRKKK